MMLCEPIREEDISKLNLENYVVEPKYDGSRAIWDKSKLIMRSGIDRTEKFKHISDKLKKLGISVVLDGEICFFENGKPAFNKLLRKENYDKAIFVIFDILQFGDLNLRNLPLLKRRKYLEEFYYSFQFKQIEMISQFAIYDITEFKTIQRDFKEWEGLILKLKDSVYLNKRSDYWLKFKFEKTEDVNILDYEKTSGWGSYGVLITDKGRVAIKSKEDYDFYMENKPTIAEVRFLEINENGKMRMPVLERFKGI